MIKQLSDEVITFERDLVLGSWKDVNAFLATRGISMTQDFTMRGDMTKRTFTYVNAQGQEELSIILKRRLDDDEDGWERL